MINVKEGEFEMNNRDSFESILVLAAIAVALSLLVIWFFIIPGLISLEGIIYFFGFIISVLVIAIIVIYINAVKSPEDWK